MNPNLVPNIASRILIGTAIGDALGVPVEFLSREKIAQNPVTDMRAFGTHRQPKGTWSDDSSMLFCTAEALTQGYDLQQIALNFVRWYQDGFWTPHGEVFDIGNATRSAILSIKNGTPLTQTGGTSEHSNGNGSLMRILPIALVINQLTIKERFQIVSEVSALTHAHFRSCLACFIYVEYALKLMVGQEKTAAYQNLQQEIKAFITQNADFQPTEIQLFHRVLEENISRFPAQTMHGSGYVLHTLESSIWALLTTQTYAEAVLKAVNLGEDTDTTGAVTGGLAGIYYGIENIPALWKQVLVRKTDIEKLAQKLEAKYA